MDKNENLNSMSSADIYSLITDNSPKSVYEAKRIMEAITCVREKNNELLLRIVRGGKRK